MGMCKKHDKVPVPNVAKLRAVSDEYRGSGPRFSGSDLGMAVQVLENRHGRETMHSTGAGFTLVFVNLATFRTAPFSSSAARRLAARSYKTASEPKLACSNRIPGFSSPRDWPMT